MKTKTLKRTVLEGMVMMASRGSAITMWVGPTLASRISNLIIKPDFDLEATLNELELNYELDDVALDKAFQAIQVQNELEALKKKQNQ
jgi:hypothetical protein